MSSKKIILFLPLILSILTFTTSCRRNANNVLDDTRTAGRHMQRGFRSLGGKHGDSRLVASRDQFMGDGFEMQPNPADYADGQYIPLEDDPNGSGLEMADVVTRPPKESPGDPGSSLPSIEAFQDPSTNPQLAGTFRNIYFAYNSNLIKGQDSLDTIRKVAQYMRQNRNTYVFVEGHCDERGPEAYNLALGSHRANAVRNLLISDGVSPDNVFTISYGKERPAIFGNDEESWLQNRRAEFKVFQR